MESTMTQITPEQALLVLSRLWEKGGPLRAAIREEIKEMLTSPEVDDIAQEVLAVLDRIDVQEFREKLNSDKGLYSTPEEVAMEVIQEELAPFHEQMDRYRELQMFEQEKHYCMGLLKGIYRFEKESKSKFKEYSGDLPAEYFETLLNSWWKRGQSRQHRSEMSGFIKEDCPDWASH